MRGPQLGWEGEMTNGSVDDWAVAIAWLKRKRGNISRQAHAGGEMQFIWWCAYSYVNEIARKRPS